MFRVVGSTVGCWNLQWVCCVGFARVGYPPIATGAMVVHPVTVCSSTSYSILRQHWYKPYHYTSLLSTTTRLFRCDRVIARWPARGPEGSRKPGLLDLIWRESLSRRMVTARWLNRPSLSVIGFLQPSTPMWVYRLKARWEIGGQLLLVNSLLACTVSAK